MTKPLSRLLVLRQRLKDVAEMELNVTVRAMRDTEAHLEHDGIGIGEEPQTHAAQDLQDVAYRRELAVGHLKSLTQLVQERQEELAQAKRQERQVELLVQKRAKEAAQKQVRIEAATLDDWYRAITWEEK